jgi:TRAP-type C4-dicarboxylate transport system substrate-binding protein
MGIFAISREAFDDLSAADQAIVREVMTKTMGELDEAARTDNERAIEVLEKAGLTTIEVDAAAVEGWRRIIEGTYPRIRARPDIDAAMFDALLELLAEYRADSR